MSTRDATDPSVLSTMSKKLSRDIHFATNVGRESPFDPFVGRDITRLFMERKDPSASLMYYPKREGRKAAYAISIARTTGRAATPGMRPGPSLTDASYDLPDPGKGKSISFPKAKRDPLPNVPERTNFGAEPDVPRLPDGTPIPQPESASPTAERVGVAPSTLSVEDLMNSRQRAMYHAMQRPASQQQPARGPVFERATSREGRAPKTAAKLPMRGEPSTANLQRHEELMSPPRPRSVVKEHERQRRARMPVFPWEIEARKRKEAESRKQRLLDIDKHGNSPPPTRGGLREGNSPGFTSASPMASVGVTGYSNEASAAASPRTNLATTNAGSPRLGASAAANAGVHDSKPSAGGKDTPGTAGPEDDENTEEQWLEQRRQLLARFGLLSGPNLHRSHSSAPRGPDFDAVPSRDRASTGFIAPGKECNDLMYNPKAERTSKARHVPRVELGRQASRARRGDEQRQYVESLLNYDRLSKLHRDTRDKQKRSFGGFVATGNGKPGAQTAQASQSRSNNNNASAMSAGSACDLSPEDRIFAKPLSAADELAYNYASLRPPSRTPNVVPHTTDAFLGADRSDEPLAAVLGGDPAPYRRAAKRAVSSMR